MKAVKKIAILTSGGDAPGMNACLRGVVRTALNKGWEVYGIRDAYQGLVAGGEQLFPIDWGDVSWNFREGGTFLGSARYTDLVGDSDQAMELKQKALLNLTRQGISGLVVIGGDGSLTGAYDLFTFLQQNGPLNAELKGRELTIVGIPGSIDNDIAFTDMSIGADTTLNTIVECIDKLRDTATSHKRINIVEVMGRLRGYLAVMSGLATGADRIFIREEKITREKLNAMLQNLAESFAHGQKAGVIVRSEGAIFSTNFLKEIIAVLLEPKREVRETVLGHLQRGGNPTAFEIILATRMGVKAVQLIEEKHPEPQMIGLNNGTIISVELAACLNKIRTPEFRGELSQNTKRAFHLNKILEDTPVDTPTGQRIGILTDGSNVSGMNMAIRAVARLAINSGIEVIGIKGGFSGLVQGSANAFPLVWSMLEMSGVLRRAGTLLGVSGREFSLCKENFTAMQNQVEALKLTGLIVIGDAATFEYTALLAKRIVIPVVAIPAALNCNLPGTDWVIGMDSALNDLRTGIDRAADAAHVLKKIFLIHIKGSYCSCLVKSAALAGGAESVIIDDEEDDRDVFQRKLKTKILNLYRIISLGKSFATIVFFSRRPAEADQALADIKMELWEAGIKLETSLVSLETSLGGIVPTAFDRILAQRLGEKALATLQKNMNVRNHSFHIVGIHRKEIKATPFDDRQEKRNRVCTESLTDELDQAIALMTEPNSGCIGMGGDIEWTDTGNESEWQGKWTCKKCNHTQNVVFNSEKMLCVFCRTASCHNYGYIRISRRL